MVLRFNYEFGFKTKFSDCTTKLYIRCYHLFCEYSNALLLVLGITLLASATLEPALAFDTGHKYKSVCGSILNMFGQDNGFGALLTAIAGVGAICASAMGGFKMAWALIVVSVGSFILGKYVELFFNPCT